jgi:two-component system, sensor histidine kinase
MNANSTTPSSAASQSRHDRVSFSAVNHTPTRFSREVKADQLRLFCQQAIRIPIGVAFLAGYIIHLFWELVRQDVLIGWIVALCGALLYRTWLSARLLRRALTNDEVDRWTRFMIGFALFNGALGGSAGLLFFPSAPLPEKALLTMVVAAWCAAAIATSGMMPKSFYAFAVPLMLPLTIGWWGHPEHWFNAVLLVAFLVYLVLYVRDSGRMTTDALHTRYENLALVEELRAKQEEAESARDRAELASRAKTQFLAAASHDLRQPLTALALFNRLLSDKATEPEIQRIAGHIDASVTSLESLMAALLDISKLDAGTIQPQRVVVSVAKLLQRLEAEYGPIAAEKGLQLSVHTDDTWAHSDPVMLERIVRNLVENALRYTHAGKIELRAAGAGDMVKLEVIDTGVGIPSNEQSRIFEEFYQIGRSDRDVGQGLGLGLAIVQRMATLLDCMVTVHSVVGQGSTFTVLIPKAQQPTQTAPVTGPNATREVMDLRGLKVVVVDDEEEIVAAIKALLESWGCEVREGMSMAGAMAALDATGERPDLLIVDFRLRNGETGIDIARKVAFRYGRVPTILITGDTAPDRLREAMESGLGLLHKPVNADALREKIEVLLELR